MPGGTGPRAIVAGGQGFIGSVIVSRLVAEGYRVLTLDLRPSQQSETGDPQREILLADVTGPEAAQAVAGVLGLVVATALAVLCAGLGSFRPRVARCRGPS